MTPRFYTINGWVLALFALALSAFVFHLLTQVGHLNIELGIMQASCAADRVRAEDLTRATRYCEQLTNEMHVDAKALRAQLAALEKACGVEW